MTKIPLSILPQGLIMRYSSMFLGLAERLSKTFKHLEAKLKQAEFKLTPKEYIARSLTATSFLFIILAALLSLAFIKSDNYILIGLFLSFILCAFALVHQMNYPNLMTSKRVRDIDKNLLSTLKTILIQINSGVSLFDSLVYIAKSDYGEISRLFDKMIKKVDTGTPQINALDDLAEDNPSPFFRKAIWQLINGMKAGSDISKVLSSIIDSLSKEQLIQIEQYGSRLNPLAMFYMLVVIIIPSLGVTFITVMSSFFGSATLDSRYLLGGLFVFVFIFQIIFLGLIKTRRPSLLED